MLYLRGIRMTEKRVTSECTVCKYLIGYSDNIRCLMKKEFCIINGKTSYPTNCEYFQGD